MRLVNQEQVVLNILKGFLDNIEFCFYVGLWELQKLNRENHLDRKLFYVQSVRERKWFLY